MVHRPNIDDNFCFVLMPFGGKFDGYYQHVIKPAVENILSIVRRGDEIYGTGPIITDIWNAIWKARVIVADVTGKNANVNYELGLAHALGVPTILLTQKLSDVPFDYRHRRCIPYDTSDAVWQAKLRDDLIATLEAVVGGEDSRSDLIWPYETRMNSLDVAEPVSLGYTDLLVHGAEVIRQLITRAFGPHGVFIPTKDEDGATIATRQGLVIARSLKSGNPVEQIVMSRAAQISSLVTANCGDGSKTSLLLFQALIRGGISAIGGPHRLNDVIRAMGRAVEISLAELDAAAQPTTDQPLRQVGRSAAGDVAIADVLTEAFTAAGRDGIVSVSSGSGNSTTMSVSEGMQIDRGFLSEKFITNASGIPASWLTVDC